tara:strand:+ start:48 stop:203 length:156 start_codon:yes stop_codon:yes gene_type:complete
MTLQDIKLARPSKEMVLFRREIELKIQNCRSLSEYKELEEMAKVIDSKLKG